MNALFLYYGTVRREKLFRGQNVSGWLSYRSITFGMIEDGAGANGTSKFYVELEPSKISPALHPRVPYLFMLALVLM